MRPLVMGILNVTPDSFSDGGQFDTTAAAVTQGIAMVSEGADIIDVGGESTRPGADAVSIDAELERAIPVIEALSDTSRISIDTRRPEVARAAVAAGATIINDVSASLGLLAAELGVGWVAMHMQGEPRSMQESPFYDDVVAEVKAFLTNRADAARDAGATEIWIDPGVGFGKSHEHNLRLLACMDEFVRTDYPVAIGVSRKSTMGILTAASDGADEPSPVSDRLEASIAATTFAMAQGVSLVRCHDVKAHWQAAMVIAGGNRSSDERVPVRASASGQAATGES